MKRLWSRYVQNIASVERKVHLFHTLFITAKPSPIDDLFLLNAVKMLTNHRHVVTEIASLLQTNDMDKGLLTSLVLLVK